MIGKQVKASGNEVELMEGQSVAIRSTPKEGVQPIKVGIYAEGGKIVRELDLDNKVDAQGIKWDGKDSDGKSLPSGKYTFRVQGIDHNGQATELGSELSGRVTGVEMDGKDPLLVVQTPLETPESSWQRSIMCQPMILLPISRPIPFPSVAVPKLQPISAALPKEETSEEAEPQPNGQTE